MKLQRAGCVRRAVSATLVTATVGLGTGCETKSFIDPSEMGRYQRTPLVVPILDKLVIGVEADEAQFSNAREVRAEDLEAVNVDDRIGPNDLIQYTIQDLTGIGTVTAENKRVSKSGQISLPYLGQVSVVGMTEAEAEQAVVKALADAGILPRAIVSVAVVESQNRIYSLSGAITQPGAYPLLRGDLRLLEAIANARGASSETGIEYVYVIRKKQAGTGDTTTTPATPPGDPGVDPLAPQGRAAPAGEGVADRPMYALLMQEQPASQTPAEARAAAARLADQLREGSTTGPAVEPIAGAAVDPAVDPAVTPAPVTDAETRRDRVIQIEGAGTQPALPGETITTIPPGMNDPTMTDPGMSDPAMGQPQMGGTGMDGMTPAAGDDFEFTAPSEPTDQEIIRVPFAQLKKGELKYNIVLQPQDMVIVPFPPFGTYYMGGHVQRTGAYSLPPTGMTLKNAIASAGMLDQLAIPARTDVIRRIGANQEMFVRVDLERIFTGLEPDIFLKENDQVMVGTNLGAPFAAALRNAFRVTYGFGFLYDRNYGERDNNFN